MANWNGAVATREETRELKRRAAMRVAAKIFNEKGYHATSLDEIADQIGVTKTSLYYYFKNKENLLYECLRLTYDAGATARAEADAFEGTAFEKLCLLYTRFTELLLTERGAYTTMANIRSLPEENQKELLVRRRQLDRFSRSLLRQAIAEGSIRNVDVRVTSNYFLGAVNWVLRWHTEQDERSPQEVAGIFIDLLTNGITPRGAAPGLPPLPGGPDAAGDEAAG